MASAEVQQPDRFNVVCWNILLDKTRSSLPSKHPNHVAPQRKRISSQALALEGLGLSLDVVGISEAHLGNGQLLARTLGYEAGYWFEHNTHKRKNEHIGMFGRRVEDAEYFDLGNDKLAVITRIGEVAIAGLHLRNEKWGNERTEQIQALVEYLKDDEKVVVMGDFNAEPFEKARRLLHKDGFESAFLQTGRFRPFTYPTPGYRDIMLRPWQRRVMRRGLRIDDIYTRGLTVNATGTFVGDSDHVGLWAEVENPLPSNC